VGATEQDEAGQGSQEVAVRAPAATPARPPLPLYNGVMSPDRWTMLGRIATTTADTDFVPKGLRGKPGAVMACLLYGDSLGLHPSVSLTDVYVADGKVGISGALMLAKIREAGHKVKFETLRGEDGSYVGSTAKGWRLVEGEIVDEDEWTYTMEDARRAGLYPNSSPKAAWMKSPEVMCRWRAVAQLSRFLFPDVFRGGSIYTPDEAEEVAYSERISRNGSAPGADAPPAAESQEGEPEWGDDPLLAAWLLALFAQANEIEDGVWLPKKVKLALKGRTQPEREEFAVGLAAWITEHGQVPAERPVETEQVADEDVVVLDLQGEAATEETLMDGATELD
jgi:hypothetical protein